MDLYKYSDKLHLLIKIILGLNLLILVTNLFYGWIENNFNYSRLIGNVLVSIALIINIRNYNKTKKELN
jgi:hypothetical protein